jgi:hypothetical protein
MHFRILKDSISNVDKSIGLWMNGFTRYKRVLPWFAGVWPEVGGKICYNTFLLTLPTVKW